MIKILTKRRMLFFACSVGVAILLSYEFSRGILSPRSLGVALVLLCIAIGTGAVTIIKKSANEFAVISQSHGTTIDAATRKRLLWRMRRAKITIVVMLVTLAFGLINIRTIPVPGLLVGLAMNVLITAESVQTVFRVKKSTELASG
jgi:hypothetical protein